jgi:flagellar biosynthesis protein FlhA
MSQWSRWQDLIFPLGIVASVLVILIPMPPFIMDILLSANVTISIIILLTTIYVRTPMEFNIFPTVLLATTLARLVLNVASTRLILTHGGKDKLNAAGGVIESFGNFVAGEQIVVGIIIFIIIIVIQFLVITKGATRISEVAARFILDAMPGKQMAIDADLNAHIIDENEARRRREEIAMQADFYGAMDGASKFVRGDAIAGIVITIINVVGGFAIGVFQSGLTVAQAAEIYTKLTIGDGLVSQLPAFLISLAAGLLTTRSTGKSDLPVLFLQQLFSNPRSLLVAGGFVVVLIFTQMPMVPLLTIGAGCFGLALSLQRKEKAQAISTALAEKKPAATPPEPPKTEEEKIAEYLKVEPIELELSVSLIRLADIKRGGDLLSRITSIRQQIAMTIGIAVPKLRIKDNTTLGDGEYRVKINNVPVAQGKIHIDRLLAMNTGSAEGKLIGIEAVDPAFGQPVVWIEQGQRMRAEMNGYTLVEPVTVLATHLNEIIVQHADEILTRDETKKLIDRLATHSPAVVAEVMPNLMKLAEVQQVLHALLREAVPVRQLSTILETLGDYAGKTKDIVVLTEYVRSRLARTISAKYRDDEGKLTVMTLDPSLEDRIYEGVMHPEKGIFIRMSPSAIEKTCQKISAELQPLVQRGRVPVLLVNPRIRAGLKALTYSHMPRLVVLSYGEITRDTKLEAVGMIADIPLGKEKTYPQPA